MLLQNLPLNSSSRFLSPPSWLSDASAGEEEATGDPGETEVSTAKTLFKGGVAAVEVLLGGADVGVAIILTKTVLLFFL